MPIINNDVLRSLVQPRYTSKTLAQILLTLEQHQALSFSPLRTGLFPATGNQHSQQSGYKNAWVRDNVHVANAHWVNGNSEAAVRNVSALCEFFTRHRSRFLSVIRDPTLAKVPNNRPHVRFDGESLTESPEKWSHDQNDALGYFLWLYSRLASEREFTPTASNMETLSLFPKYFNAIQYWQDEDSGHWEEPPRKIAASSIGAVVAGLEQMEYWLRSNPEAARQLRERVPKEFMTGLIAAGTAALEAILPWECRGSPTLYSRQYDAALLFLIYPLQVVDSHQAVQIVENVVSQLQGEYGIRRYVNDSFYCTDYESNIDSRDLTKDFSDDISTRDAFLVPGEEAQWCLFDPIISIYYGLKFRQTQEDADLLKETEYLNRSLGQITGSEDRNGPFRCPELYYFEKGHLQTSRSTPLLWTQANLWVALKTMEENL